MKDTTIMILAILCGLWVVLGGTLGFDPIFHQAFKGSWMVVRAAIVFLMFFWGHTLFPESSGIPTEKTIKEKRVK